MKKIILTLVMIMLLLTLVGCGHKHEYIDEVVAPTCTEKGYTKHTCECGDTYNNSEIEAKGHSFGEWEVVEEATEEEKGLKQRECTVCFEKEKEEIPMLEHVHKYTDKVVKPTCTEDGYTEHTCECGEIYLDEYVDKIGHKYNDFVIDKEPTFDEEGVKSKYCVVCNNRAEITSIPKLCKLSFSQGEVVYSKNNESINLSFLYGGNPIDNNQLDFSIIRYGSAYGEINNNELKTFEFGPLILTAKLKSNNSINCQVLVIVYPNMGGYPVKIAVDSSDLNKFDPFLVNYTNNDKEAKQKAIMEVEELFNCKIEFTAYPSHAMIGISRINYLKNQAMLGISDYDFVYISFSYLNELYEHGVYIDLMYYYTLYGQNFMTEQQMKKVTLDNDVMAGIFDKETEKYNLFIMPYGRDYSSYNYQCGADSSYLAFTEVILRTQKYLNEK